MTRTQDLRAGARRARPARPERVFASPVQLKRPLLAALLTITLTAIATSLAGLSIDLVLAITAAVALAGAIVAHRTVGGLVAGVGLLLIRPYSVGERLRITSPADCTGIEVEVIRLGLVNTTLATPDGVLVVPNTQLMRGLPAAPEPGRRPCDSMSS
jgi:small-conductance mechanosensitive channel